MGYPSSASNEILEYAIAEVNMNSNKKLYLISVYARRDNRRIYVDVINALFQRLCDNSNYYVVVGDLNARRKAWGRVGHYVDKKLFK